MSGERRAVRIVASLLLVQVLSLPLLFGNTTATIKGRVTDSDGVGVPKVPLKISSATQGSGRKQVVTDIEGNFRIPLLPPASDYYISIDYPGFAAIQLGPYDLDAGKTTVADVTLRTDAESTEVLQIIATGNTVDPDNPTTSTTLNKEFLEGLPIISHNYQDFLVLAPGVTDTDGDGNPNIHGGRDTELQTRLDGGNITDPVSGTFGQNLNADIIEEMEIITAGASAEFGRATSFANIITKSGGNEFEGRFSIFWQGKFLNGEGADNNDINSFDSDFPSYQDIRTSLSLGGAILRDKLWYFTSIELLDTEIPQNVVGSDILFTSRGNQTFAKLTWQANSFNKLALQLVGDPREFRGLGLGLGVSPDSDFEFDQGGLTPQLKWTSTISPSLLMEASVTHFDSGISITPISRHFEPTEIALIQDSSKTLGTVQALYPCTAVNCDPAFGEKKTFQFDLLNGRVNGPFFQKTDDERIRNQLKTDLSYNIEDAWGQHNIKSGLEFADEKFHDVPIFNPFLVDQTRPLSNGDPTRGGNTTAQISGQQLLTAFNPLATPQNASSFNSSFYLLDAWKPVPNLTINAGFRLDREDIDTSGFTYFDPRVERRKSINLWKSFCAEALRQSSASVPASSNCHPQNYPYDGKPPVNISSNQIRSFVDADSDGINDVPAAVASMDFDRDGFINPATTDQNGTNQHFTSFTARETENFNIENTNIAPRLSVSWDPWADGKTRLFATAGRFYDRLFLATVAGEIGPDTLNFTFRPDPVSLTIQPGAASIATSTISVNQVDRDLKTPRTDELSIGFERELAPEWSFGVTYIKRKGYDLLQDQDINHYTCPGAGVVGLSPQTVCGDSGTLEVDRFGSTQFSQFTQGGDFGFNVSSQSRPNDAPDLFTINNSFNQVLRVGNFNSLDFQAWELTILKRLHRNWQMQASYTWSEAFGQAEAFNSGLGNDPQTVDDEEGFLAFDQRHVLKFQAVTRLPHEIGLGGIVQWSSGTPFSVIRTIVDTDSTGNQIFRTFFPTQQRNDQRNEGFWKIDARIEKNFVIGKVQAAGFLNVENLLDTDQLNITSLNLEAFNGVGLTANRDFGRRFEIGATFNF